MIELLKVESGPELDEIRTLVLEYKQSLNFNLCFQDFDTELRELPGEYAPPAGRLILCKFEGKPAGCIALRQLEPRICEMKRLFVRPQFRGRQLGRKLTDYLIAEARRAGYDAMRLDTIAGSMDHAIAMYRELGFREIPPYYANPTPGAIYMELALIERSAQSPD